MKVQKQIKQGAVILSVSGRMDGETSENFDEMVEPILKEMDSRLLINLNDLTFINSRGLSSLIHIAQAMKDRGQFALCHLHGPVKEIFEAADLGRLIASYDHEEDALKHLSA